MGKLMQSEKISMLLLLNSSDIYLHSNREAEQSAALRTSTPSRSLLIILLDCLH